MIFIGDIHRRWDHVERGLAMLSRAPRDVVLLGDMECHAPLDALVAPILATGARLHWIHGNHDADGGPEMWANLADPVRNPVTAAGALHGRVAVIDGLRVAGLGGTFRAGSGPRRRRRGCGRGRSWRRISRPSARNGCLRRVRRCTPRWRGWRSGRRMWNGWRRSGPISWSRMRRPPATPPAWQ
ncbi:metallophosphoesterase [Siccirubricoccus deserti]